MDVNKSRASGSGRGASKNLHSHTVSYRRENGGQSAVSFDGTRGQAEAGAMRPNDGRQGSPGWGHRGARRDRHGARQEGAQRRPHHKSSAHAAVQAFEACLNSVIGQVHVRDRICPLYAQLVRVLLSVTLPPPKTSLPDSGILNYSASGSRCVREL